MALTLIGLTGHKGSGKDEVARILCDAGFTRVALADPLKRLATAIGWDGRKTDLPPCPECGLLQGRQLLQVLGTEGVRKVLGEEAWIRLAQHEADRHEKVVVPDIRFINEAQWIDDFGGEIWRVERPGYNGDAHASETEMEDILADRIIYNDGDLDDLTDAIKWILGAF